MLSEFLSFIAGGVLGVVCDRAWKRVETRVSVDVRLGVRMSDPKHRRPGAVLFNVINHGREELPPYDLQLFSPGRGRLGLFDRTHEGVQRPGQEFQFIATIDADFCAMYRKWHAVNHPMIGRSDPPPNEFTLLFEIEHSMRSIFQSRRIGESLAAWLRQCADAGGLQMPAAEAWETFERYTLRTRIKRWREWREIRRRHPSSVPLRFRLIPERLFPLYARISHERLVWYKRLFGSKAVALFCAQQRERQLQGARSRAAALETRPGATARPL